MSDQPSAGPSPTPVVPPSRKSGLVLGVVVVVVVAILVALYLPTFSQSRQDAQRAQCMNNLKQLAIACGAYAEEHGGMLTCKIDDLRKYAKSEKFFHCPSAPDPSTPSYEIVCVNGSFPTNDPNVVMLREKSANHRGFRTVAHADGHIALAPEKRSPD